MSKDQMLNDDILVMEYYNNYLKNIDRNIIRQIELDILFGNIEESN